MTQAEYVKMLYALQKNPAGASALVDALRRRGIDFALTDGVRGLTRSKSSNNEEMKRALEEAERRRQNPEAAKLPSEKEAADVLEKTRLNTLASIEEMPDFVVKQIIARSESYAGTGNWRPLDNVVIGVSYSSKKGEQYRVLAINGALVNAETGSNYAGLNGNTTGGEFVEHLSKLFRPESKTKFEILTTDVLRGHPTLVFNYEIAIENNVGGGISIKSGGTVSRNYTVSSVPAGQKGKIWVDRANSRVLRIEFQLTDIPSTFPVKAFDASIDYDWVEIAGERFLLPLLADNRFTSTEGTRRFQDRNLIRFKNYQKYGSEVRVVEEDSAPISDEKP